MTATTTTSAIDWLLAVVRGEHDGPRAWAEGAVLDRMAQDDVWCGGRWPAALLAEMEAASHAG